MKPSNEEFHQRMYPTARFVCDTLFAFQYAPLEAPRCGCRPQNKRICFIGVLITITIVFIVVIKTRIVQVKNGFLKPPSVILQSAILFLRLIFQFNIYSTVYHKIASMSIQENLWPMHNEKNANAMKANCGLWWTRSTALSVVSSTTSCWSS